jgi:TolB-like protein
MSSIIEGYNYDIFISYRQKDNKGDKWVSEFVESLKTELESTFKEDISVYFDINPHDGLLETHDVDASLQDKLKCLIFIPIISRTYCDSKSFAWEHEFKAFVKQASKDQLGLKVKLPNGNVASRILPVQIHDLYPEDKSLVEKEIGGFLRTIEFIYKESGVNKPLTAVDNEVKNLNKTTYRIQINKVANAIDEIIHGLRSQSAQEVKVDQPAFRTKEPIPERMEGEASGKSKLTKIRKSRMVIGAAVIIIIAGLFVVFRIIGERKRADDAGLEKSIAVLPFINDGPDQENTYFINGIMDEILNDLQKIKDFRVLSRTSTEQYRTSNVPTVPEIARKLGVNYIVEGRGQKFGNRFRLRVQLIAVKNEKQIWGESFERELKESSDIFNLQSLIAQTIASELKASILPAEKQLIDRIGTGDLRAYDLYLKANAYRKDYQSSYNLNSYKVSEDLYKASLAIDSVFAKTYSGLAGLYLLRDYYENYFNEEFLDSCIILADKALSIDPKLEDAYFIKGSYYQALGKIDDALSNYDEAIRISPNLYMAYRNKAMILGGEKQDLVQCLEMARKALTLVGGDERPALLVLVGAIYQNTGFMVKAKFFYKEALSLNGDSAKYFYSLSTIEWNLENFKESWFWFTKALQKGHKYGLDDLLYLSMTGQDQAEYDLAEKLIADIRTSGILPLVYSHRLGYALWKAGEKNKAQSYFNDQIKFGTESIKLNREIAGYKAAQYDLAATYSFLGDKKWAYRYLEEFCTKDFYPLWWITLIKHDPLFDNIRSEDRFRNAVGIMEAKYQAGHEKVRKWLEEQGEI